MAQDIGVFRRVGRDWTFVGMMDAEKVDIIELGEELSQAWGGDANVRIIQVEEVIDLGPDESTL